MPVWFWQEVQALPRKAGLIRYLLVALPLWAGLAVSATAQTDCARSLDVMDQPSGLSVAYTAPCDPYASLLLSYGSLRIVEEADRQGNLVMALPRLQGARSLTIEHGETLLSAAVPPSQAPVYPYVAIDWPEGRRFGTLQSYDRDAVPMGFLNANGQTHLDLLVGTPPSDVWLSVPVTLETCEQPLQASVLTSAATAPLALSFTLPACDSVGQTLRIPLG